jgi:hypothetical protein
MATVESVREEAMSLSSGERRSLADGLALGFEKSAATTKPGGGAGTAMGGEIRSVAVPRCGHRFMNRARGSHVMHSPQGNAVGFEP